jgi:K+/H+ antiporter YhaU regulatory subunit KhtT
VDVWNRTGASLIGLRDPSGRYYINPSSTMEILPGSQLIFLGTRTQLINVKEKVAK